MPQPPPNAFPPGTPLTVGSHKITIQKYISEGGFAYVYKCTIDPPFNGNATACLKRVVVPNKWQLTLLRQEVDAMKRLRGNSHIVSYIDSHASRLPVAAPDAPQQYEVLLLMEYCAGKGLIDFMNTRLTNRLTEPEILSIMGQITTAVAMCHHLTPPLIHRDIKIENVLLDANGSYKLCDFGSAVEYCQPPTSQADLAKLHNDIMQNTTPQYRAPEMIDLARGFPIDDKSDIWALGIFLYKLCYYTTPFESPSQKTLQDLQNSILQCTTTLRFPGSPAFSPRLQNVIHCCLREDPRRRPNALQLLQEICLMQNVPIIPDVVPYSVKLAKLSAVAPNEAEKPTKKPELPKRDGDLARKISNGTKVDMFAHIDKSKILQMGKNIPAKPRPKSEIYPAKSSSSLQDFVKLHVSESNSNISSARKPDDSENSTLNFLRSREVEESPSRQNTGGSLKASIKNGLRRISTGGSISSQRSGSFSLTRTAYGSDKPNSEENIKPLAQEQSQRMNSIQRRVQQLLNNKEKKAPKTASGYGKYTEQDDISAINFNDLSAHVSMESLSSPRTEVHEVPETFEFSQKPANKIDTSASKPKLSRPKVMKQTYKTDINEPNRPLPKVRSSAERSHKPLARAPPPCPPSLSVRNSSSSLEANSRASGMRLPSKTKEQGTKKKAPPPKPIKPQHLKESNDRRLSTSSDISMPDLEDLEKQFARRFPSYV
ncbi:hypothetical protein JCM33374_g6202 [Metschnikowia sp. JCM 33374]|nr:hypothetical protein JCM33374_g6202 [Metschnikowia sp. JCM 33374]